MKDKWQKQRALYNRREQLSCLITKSCCDRTPMQLVNGHIPQAQHFEEYGNNFCLLSPTHTHSPPPPQSAAACVVSLFSAQATAVLATDSDSSTRWVIRTSLRANPRPEGQL